MQRRGGQGRAPTFTRPRVARFARGEGRRPATPAVSRARARVRGPSTLDEPLY
jgi:hypothetical protein